MLLVTQTDTDTNVGQSTEACKYKEAGVIGAILEAGYHK